MSAVLDSPYAKVEGGLWLRGNLHVHSSRSDGKLDPQGVIDAYAALGYDFLALSDHDLPSDYAGLDPRGLVLIPAQEVSAGGHHLLAMGSGSGVQALPEPQAVIDAVNAAGGLAVLCHPNWEEHFNHYTYSHMLGLTGYAGVEVLNGAVAGGAGCARADVKWDRMLSAGRRVWGLATDDAHGPKGYGRGWCVVRAAERSPRAVLTALRTGNFYASSGVAIDDVGVEGSEIRLAAREAQATVVYGEYRRRLARVEGPEVVLDTSKFNSAYFRAEVLGAAGSSAWTQPFFAGGEEVERRRALLAETPVLEVKRLESVPELRGDLGDPGWRKCDLTRRFLDADSGRPAPLITELRLFVAGGEICFGFKCEEPEPERMRVEHRGNGLRGIWCDDSLEIFLAVDPDSETYFHVMLNADGFHFVEGRGRSLGGARALQPRVRTARVPRGWNAEVILSLAELGATPIPGTRWGFNAVRNCPRLPARFSWSMTGTSNHRPERFGRIQF